MLRIALFGDIHGELERLRSTVSVLPDAAVDLTLVSGDVGIDVPWPEPARHAERGEHDESVAAVLGLLRDELGAPVVFVPGNHDLPDPPSELPGTNADGQVLEVSGLRVAGLGGAGPARFGFPYEWGEDDARAVLSRLHPQGSPAVDIFLCHTPPLDSALDRVHRGTHVGSAAVGEWLPRLSPGLFVCGHIHEAWGLAWVDGIACVNAGALAPPVEQEIAWIVSWDGGPQKIESFRRGLGGAAERRQWHPAV